MSLLQRGRGERGIFVHMTDIISSVQEVNRPRVKIFYNYCHLSKYPVIGYLRTIICVLLIKDSDDTVKMFLSVTSHLKELWFTFNVPPK